jgi:hypothetical protein
MPLEIPRHFFGVIGLLCYLAVKKFVSLDVKMCTDVRTGCTCLRQKSGHYFTYHGVLKFFPQVEASRRRVNAHLSSLSPSVTASAVLFEKQEVKSQHKKAGPDGDDMGDAEGTGAS